MALAFRSRLSALRSTRNQSLQRPVMLGPDPVCFPLSSQHPQATDIGGIAIVGHQRIGIYRQGTRKLNRMGSFKPHWPRSRAALSAISLVKSTTCHASSTAR